MHFFLVDFIIFYKIILVNSFLIIIILIKQNRYLSASIGIAAV